MQLDELYPTMKKKSGVNYGLWACYTRYKDLEIQISRSVYVKDRSYFKFGSLAMRLLI